MSLNRFERWCNWMLLEHGAWIEERLSAIWDSYEESSEMFVSDKLYFGCGHDVAMAQYHDWDMCDLRDTPDVIRWDVLMGFPHVSGTLTRVKSKLTLGMFTQAQAKFVIREVARILAVGGVFDLTFRNFDYLLERRRTLKPELFVRYIYGSGLYYGSRRRSCWTAEEVIALADKYKLEYEAQSQRGMNTQLTLVRAPGALREFSPEPKIKRNPDGTICNDGGDFPSEHR